MSDSGPAGDPFEGFSIFGDLSKLFSQQGDSGWEAARQLAAQMAAGGETEANVDPVDRMAIEQLARVAELQVESTTGLTAGHAAPVAVTAVTRAAWAQATLKAYRPLFEELTASLGGLPAAESGQTDPEAGDAGDPGMALFGNLMRMMGPLLLGMTAGSMVGHLGARAMGGYDLPVPRPPSDALLLVPANIDHFGRDWNLPSDDLRLWVCLRDMTMHTVLGVDHIRGRLTDLLERYARGFRPDPSTIEERLGQLDLTDPGALQGLQSTLGDPDVVLGAIQSPEQRQMLPELDALVATLVGYVDHVMASIGTTLISSYGKVTEAVHRHRVEAAPSDRFVERLLGLNIDQASYDRGAAFVTGVVERAGDEGLTRLFHSERELPTPSEVDAPGLWLARIDLPS